MATLTMQVIAAEVGAVQTSQLLCITDSAKKKTYTVGKQSISNGSSTPAPAAASAQEPLEGELVQEQQSPAAWRSPFPPSPWR
ncbi:hypothetical protein [Shigella sonnei]|uniref:hypothetical protein n=1 Tax=Shigella sonnei TaxID=624 RepID=UPI00209551BC|nr:hypothetical protein [Shigella sonnei]